MILDLSSYSTLGKDRRPAHQNTGGNVRRSRHSPAVGCVVFYRGTEQIKYDSSTRPGYCQLAGLLWSPHRTASRFESRDKFTRSLKVGDNDRCTFLNEDFPVLLAPDTHEPDT